MSEKTSLSRGAVERERVHGVRQREPNSDGTRQAKHVLVTGCVLSLYSLWIIKV